MIIPGVRFSLACAIVLAGAGGARGQELEPRLYLASPVGTNVIVAAATRSGGDIIFDPTIPIDDARGRIGAVTFGYYRTFDLLGRSANLGGLVSFVRASANGLLDGTPARVERLGLTDLPIRLTINLRGSPAMDLPALVKRGLRPELGFSLSANLPVGQYDRTKVINIGTNRWSVKPELGLTVPIGPRWRADLYGGAWFFTDNPEFVGGYREQRPLVTTQFHLSYNLSRRAWAAVNGTFYAGGTAIVNGKPGSERQSNTRLGGTLSLPTGRRHALRITYAAGAWVRVGSDFTTVSAAWTYAWGRGF